MRIENFLKKLFKYRIITRDDGELYLTRFYIYRKSAWWLPSIYIHCFHSSDHDPELHNHGWKKSISLILKGSYSEERRIPGSVRTKIFKPGMLNKIDKSTFHRVDLLTPRVWTLFISGTKNDPEWGFWDRHTGIYRPWQEHIKLKESKHAL